LRECTAIGLYKGTVRDKMDEKEVKYLKIEGFTERQALKIIEMRDEYKKPNHGRYREPA